VPKGAREVDAAGKFMIPGLWDMHVHIATGRFNDSQVRAKPSWRREIFIPLLVANGVVGIRDMGGDLDDLLAMRRDIESGIRVGPQMVFAGPWLINDEVSAPESLSVMTANEGRDAAQQLKRRGADFIKILNLSPEAYLAVADESRKQGLSFVGHVPRALSAAQASDAGQKSIEHVFYSNLAFDCSSRQKDLLAKLHAAIQNQDSDGYHKAYDDAIASFDSAKASLLWLKLIKNGTWETPTLANYYSNAHRDEARMDNPNLQYIPAPLRRDWDLKKLNQGVTPEIFAWRKRQSGNDLKLVASMHRAGLPILAGSDSLDAFVFVGSSLHEELALLVRAGFTPMEALQSATLRPAEFLGRKDSQGTLESGKIADIVLLDANPLEDIANLDKIDGVVLRGRYLPKPRLEQILKNAAAAAAQN
jgi:imidazolonepropionase-like amidohydrolase